MEHEQVVLLCCCKALQAVASCFRLLQVFADASKPLTLLYAWHADFWVRQEQPKKRTRTSGCLMLLQGILGWYRLFHAVARLC